MRYECADCQFCCVSSSSAVSYCGLPSECQQPGITVGLSVGISCGCFLLFVFLLFLIYYLCRRRNLDGPQQPPIRIQSEKIGAQPQPEPPRAKLQVKAGQSPQKQPKGRKNKYNKYSKFMSPSTCTDTERGMR